MRQKSKIVTFSVVVSLLAIAVGCTKEELPKILADRFVNGGLELSVLDLNSGSRQYITNSNAVAPTSFSYCTIKKQIAYSAFVEDGEEIILWELDYKTYALTKGNNHYRFPVWSQDCSYMAFDSSSQNGTQVYILNMQDKAIRPLISNQDTLSEGASWSPDSKLIVTHLPTTNSSGQKTGYNLGIVNTENGTLVEEIPGAIDYTFSIPAWDNGGKYFLFSAKREATFDLYKYDIGLRTEALVVESDKDDRFPVMSPDGKRFVFLQSEPAQSAFRIGLFDISLKAITYLSDIQQYITSLLWLNDEQVVYSKYEPAVNKTSFYLIHINNGKRSKLGDWDGQYLTPTLFP